MGNNETIGLFDTLQTVFDCPPLTQRMIEHAESKLGYPLPAGLISVLKEKNGGWLKSNILAIPCACGTTKYRVEVLLGLGGMRSIDTVDEGKTMTELMAEQYDLPPNRVVISQFGTDGAQFVFLDYSDPDFHDDPPVEYGTVSPYPEVHYTRVARNFAEFVTRLREPIEGDVVSWAVQQSNN